jgi:hypothetical protein
MWIDVDRLVAEAIRDLRRHTSVSVPGVPYKVLVGLAKILPRKVTTRLSARAGSRH